MKSMRRPLLATLKPWTRQGAQVKATKEAQAQLKQLLRAPE